MSYFFSTTLHSCYPVCECSSEPTYIPVGPFPSPEEQASHPGRLAFEQDFLRQTADWPELIPGQESYSKEKRRWAKKPGQKDEEKEESTEHRDVAGTGLMKDWERDARMTSWIMDWERDADSKEPISMDKMPIPGIPCRRWWGFAIQWAWLDFHELMEKGKGKEKEEEEDEAQAAVTAAVRIMCETLEKSEDEILREHAEYRERQIVRRLEAAESRFTDDARREEVRLWELRLEDIRHQLIDVREELVHWYKFRLQEVHRAIEVLRKRRLEAATQRVADLKEACERIWAQATL